MNDPISSLHAWRLSRGFTAEAAAEAIGISRSYYSEIEGGASCSLRVAAAIETATEGLVTASTIAKETRKAVAAE